MTQASTPHGRTRRTARRAGFTLLAVLLVYFAPLGLSYLAHTFAEAQTTDWRTARRDSAGIVPPVPHSEASIQAYCARAYRWRGIFGEHCWLATKGSDTDAWTRFEVTGWAVRRGGQAVRVATGIADGYWYGAAPTLIRDLRGGPEVDALIARLHAASLAYPHNDVYRVWPGPNSNTYIAYLGRAVPELALKLPPTAIGKDYLPGGGVFGRPASGSGLQISLAGLFGVILSPEEGIEVNVLGLSAGVDFIRPALKLPGLGRIGLPLQQANAG